VPTEGIDPTRPLARTRFTAGAVSLTVYVGVCRSLPAVKPDPGPVNYPVGWLSFHIHVLDGLTSVRPDGPFGNCLGYSRSVPRWLDQQLPSASRKGLLWQTAEACRIQARPCVQSNTSSLAMGRAG
jgi:hypothetical protein